MEADRARQLRALASVAAKADDRKGSDQMGEHQHRGAYIACGQQRRVGSPERYRGNAAADLPSKNKNPWGYGLAWTDERPAK